MRYRVISQKTRTVHYDGFCKRSAANVLQTSGGDIIVTNEDSPADHPKLARLIASGKAELETTRLALFRDADGHLGAAIYGRKNNWSDAALNETEGRIGPPLQLWEGECVTIQLHYGGWTVAKEELPRIVRDWEARLAWQHPECSDFVYGTPDEVVRDWLEEQRK